MDQRRRRNTFRATGARRPCRQLRRLIIFNSEQAKFRQLVRNVYVRACNRIAYSGYALFRETAAATLYSDAMVLNARRRGAEQ